MRFLPKTTCEKLVKMGLKSTTEFLYLKTDKPVYALDSEPGYVAPAFTLEDFVSTDEYAKNNAKILWGKGLHQDGMYLWNHACYVMRHKILDSGDWVKFLSEEVEKIYEERNKV